MQVEVDLKCIEEDLFCHNHLDLKVHICCPNDREERQHVKNTRKLCWFDNIMHACNERRVSQKAIESKSVANKQLSRKKDKKQFVRQEGHEEHTWFPQGFAWKHHSR